MKLRVLYRFIDETILNVTMGPSTDMSDFVLNEEHLTSRNIRLGINVRNLNTYFSRLLVSG
jgi:hypothetical protein